VKALSFSRTKGIFFRWTGTKFVRSLSLADWLQRFLPLAVASSKPSGPSVSSSGIYAEAGPDVRVDFINAGLPNPRTSNWEFSDISGSAEPGLQGLILQQQ
jgi:hypothetical protein